jgi:hypothetical protein
MDRVFGVIIEVLIMAGFAYCILRGVQLMVFQTGMGMKYYKMFGVLLTVVGAIVVVFFISHLTSLYPPRL